MQLIGARMRGLAKPPDRTNWREKMNKSDQSSLLHLMETGIISETKVTKTRLMELTSWVFASANSCEKISEPLLSRFMVLEIPEYTFGQFKEIVVSRLKRAS
jgi:hypothetical protein